MLSSRTILLIGLAFVFVGTKGDDGFDLSDALAEDPPKTQAPAAPTLGVNDTGDDGFDLSDALAEDPPKTQAPAVDPSLPDFDLDFDNPKVPTKPKNPNPDEFDLYDAVDSEDKYTPTKVPKKPSKGGDADRQFGEDDLVEAAGDAYKPDVTNRKDGSKGGDQGSGSGTLTGIITGVLLALGGGVSSYILYQKKKLCFSLTGNSGEQNTKQENVHGQREDPQSYSTLLQAQPAGSN